MTEVGDGDASNVVAPLGTQDRPMNPLDHLAVTTAVDRDMGIADLPGVLHGRSPECDVFHPPLRRRNLCVGADDHEVYQR